MRGRVKQLAGQWTGVIKILLPVKQGTTKKKKEAEYEDDDKGYSMIAKTEVPKQIAKSVKARAEKDDAPQ